MSFEIKESLHFLDLMMVLVLGMKLKIMKTMLYNNKLRVQTITRIEKVQNMKIMHNKFVNTVSGCSAHGPLCPKHMCKFALTKSKTNQLFSFNGVEYLLLYFLLRFIPIFLIKTNSKCRIKC